MPLITIDLRTGSTVAQRRAISDGIHAAMVEVLGIPSDDQFHVFHEHDETTMIYQPVSFGRVRTDRFMFIQLCFNERSDELKQRLFSAIVAELRQRVQVTEDDIALVVLETGRANWWASGRVVNPATGYDERMSQERVGS
ncbi:MAG TPA: tautomerase family protein [Jatrophihabitans sp.]|nr:tautomerase family protein [Jatrophihabitans sp.]